MIGLKKQLLVFLRVAVLHRFYCTNCSYVFFLLNSTYLSYFSSENCHNFFFAQNAKFIIGKHKDNPAENLARFHIIVAYNTCINYLKTLSDFQIGPFLLTYLFV